MDTAWKNCVHGYNDNVFCVEREKFGYQERFRFPYNSPSYTCSISVKTIQIERWLLPKDYFLHCFGRFWSSELSQLYRRVSNGSIENQWYNVYSLVPSDRTAAYFVITLSFMLSRHILQRKMWKRITPNDTRYSNKHFISWFRVRPLRRERRRSGQNGICIE